MTNNILNPELKKFSKNTYYKVRQYQSSKHDGSMQGIEQQEVIVPRLFCNNVIRANTFANICFKRIDGSSIICPIENDDFEWCKFDLDGDEYIVYACDTSLK